MTRDTAPLEIVAFTSMIEGTINQVGSWRRNGRKNKRRRNLA
jgi:hypothetical protein